jgi:hypothetical protein
MVARASRGVLVVVERTADLLAVFPAQSYSGIARINASGKSNRN